MLLNHNCLYLDIIYIIIIATQISDTRESRLLILIVENTRDSYNVYVAIGAIPKSAIIVCVLYVIMRAVKSIDAPPVPISDLYV